MPNWLFFVRAIGQRLWVTASLYSLLGVAAALIAAVFAPYVPDSLSFSVGSESVGDILNILASSMLAVTTFSLAALVTAYTSVTGSVAPHAAELLVSDSDVRGPLATFVGAFLYAVVGVVAVHTAFYGAGGRVILFFITVGVLAVVVFSMLRWIAELSTLAQVQNVVSRVEEAVKAALASPFSRLANGERPDEPPADACSVNAKEIGFVQNIDRSGLEDAAERHGLTIWVCTLPGDFVHPAMPLLKVAGRPSLDSALAEDLCGRVTVGEERTFQQDPRWGMTVLGEIAARALSPGINDPGTARDVVVSVVRLVTHWVKEEKAREPEDRAHVRWPSVAPSDLLDAALDPIGRYGAADAPLQTFLHQALEALACSESRTVSRAALNRSAASLQQALQSLELDTDLDRVKRAAAATAGGRA